jgi:phospholipid/cholesterol/gamma-HCH transport system substrate-binding protein
VQNYVEDNQPLITGDVQKLGTTTKLLASQRQNLADILQTAPTTVSNAYNLYDPQTRASTGALVLPYYQSPGQVICYLLTQVGAKSLCGPLSGVFSILDGDGSAAAKPVSPPGSGLAALLTPGTADAR